MIKSLFSFLMFRLVHPHLHVTNVPSNVVRAGSGMKLMMMRAEMELCGMALCLETGLSAALEMRDAYRSFQLEAFCVVRATRRLQASARIEGSFSALLTATCGST